tara:strand:+ start:1012 stop:1212 length:201 start_codon:yes stop_codon:yes gene_type:complete
VEYIGSLVAAVAVQVMVERWEEVAVLDLLHMLVLDLVLQLLVEMDFLARQIVDLVEVALEVDLIMF